MMSKHVKFDLIPVKYYYHKRFEVITEWEVDYFNRIRFQGRILEIAPKIEHLLRKRLNKIYEQGHNTLK